MGSLTIMRFLLECDGCGAKIGAKEGFENLIEARASSYVQGWRFPSQIGVKGHLIQTASDVCPDCVPGWKPQPRSSRQRLLSKAEVSEL